MDIVKLLDLKPHPEGGFFRENYRAPLMLSELPHGAPRNASTAIYYLLPAGTFSAFHRVRSDEIWHHYDGDPMTLYIISPDGTLETFLLGHNFGSGERPQCVVPADSWQAAEPLGDRYSLCGCTVAPGFDFADFEIARSSALTEKFPVHAAVIQRLAKK